MTDRIDCTYVATAPSKDSMSGSIALTGCTPPIGNNQTLTPVDVIVIVGLMVLAGIAVQFLLNHINRKALKEIWIKTPEPSVATAEYQARQTQA